MFVELHVVLNLTRSAPYKACEGGAHSSTQRVYVGDSELLSVPGQQGLHEIPSKKEIKRRVFIGEGFLLHSFPIIDVFFTVNT